MSGTAQRHHGSPGQPAARIVSQPADVRIAAQQNGSVWSQEGELLHPQDRTSLLIEIDELIEKHGEEASAVGFLPREAALIGS